MTRPLGCRLGLHAYVMAHAPDERQQGPDRPEICRRCGKRRQGDIGRLPGAILSP